MSKYYTGIGSRATPAVVQDDMIRLANYLGHRGWTLRSGAAKGADRAFEIGAQGFKQEIWLPWRGYNTHSSALYLPNDYMRDDPHWVALRHGKVLRLARDIAEAVHPRWSNLDDTGRRMHIRNVLQVFGKKMADSSAFVVCWTPYGEAVGGSATVINLAKSQNIPVFNFFDMSLEDIKEAINEIVVDAALK